MVCNWYGVIWIDMWNQLMHEIITNFAFHFNEPIIISQVRGFRSSFNHAMCNESKFQSILHLEKGIFKLEAHLQTFFFSTRIQIQWNGKDVDSLFQHKLHVTLQQVVFYSLLIKFQCLQIYVNFKQETFGICDKMRLI